MGCDVSHDNRDVLKNSDVIILALKPDIIARVLSEVSTHISLKHLMVSVALGVPLATMEEVRRIIARHAQSSSDHCTITGIII